MDSLRLDSWGMFSDFFLLSIVEARQGTGREWEVVYVTYTIFSKIPMMTDDDDDGKRRGE